MCHSRQNEEMGMYSKCGGGMLYISVGDFESKGERRVERLQDIKE